MSMKITDLTAIATQHGWTVTTRNDAVTYTRDRETITAATWPEGTINAARGTVAAGVVATRQLSMPFSGHPIDPEGIAEALRSNRASVRPNNSGYILRVSEGAHTPYAPCPADDVSHELIPGDYPIELVNLNGLPANENPYNAIAYVPTDRGGILWTIYAYTLPNGRHPASGPTLSGNGRVLELAG